MDKIRYRENTAEELQWFHAFTIKPPTMPPSEAWILGHIHCVYAALIE